MRLPSGPSKSPQGRPTGGPGACRGLPYAVAPTRRQMRDEGTLLPAPASLSLAGFLLSHPPLIHSRNKGNTGTSPLPGGADYLILYPAITAS